MDTLIEEDPARSFLSRLRPLRGQLWALVVLLASMASVFALWRIAYDRELRASELAFIAETQDIANLLEQRMVNFELLAGGGISLFASVARPTPQQWLGYVEGMELARRFPGIAGLGFAGYLRQSRVADLQLEWRQAGWGLLDVRPHGSRDNLGVILYLEPQTAENRSAIGYDMYSEPVRRAAMTQAMEYGKPVLTGPVHLVQDGDTETTGLLLYLPAYRDVERPDTVAARKASMLGWVYVPFRVRPFVDEVLASRDSRFRIWDVTNGAPSLLFATDATGTAESSPAFRNTVEVENYGRLWRLEFDSPPLVQAVPRLRGLQNILALGVFASLLMYAIAWMLARNQSRVHAVALRLTQDYRHSEQRFRTAMEYSAIGKVILDSSGRIVEANAALGKIVGRSMTALAGERFDGLFEGDESAAEVLEPSQPGDAEGVRRETRRLHRKGGEPRHVQLTYAPLPGSVGEDIAGLVQIEDVTARLRAEAKVRALNRTLEARVALRTRELSQANQELEAFAYSVSHDLRAPLRAIDGFSKVLSERYADKLDESGLDYLARVRGAAGRMGELIDALLKMSRVSRGALKNEPIDLARIASEIVEELRTGDRERLHDVEVKIAPHLHAEGDSSLLRNLLGNLLGNAWKFTRDRKEARIEFGHAGHEFFIRDNGAGFSQEYVQKLFRPFQRLHAQAAFEGHGIGLASAKRIVERHGGTIRAEGREGEGATFYFTLPGDPDAEEG
ncbi:MAG: CHASE domain-containing protein [Lysobacter sp.]